MLAFDVEDRLGEIRIPTLLIAAEDDMLVPASSSERLAAGLPDASLRRMTGGHACNVTEADSFNEIVAGWLPVRHIQGAA